MDRLILNDEDRKEMIDIIKKYGGTKEDIDRSMTVLDRIGLPITVTGSGISPSDSGNRYVMKKSLMKNSVTVMSPNVSCIITRGVLEAKTAFSLIVPYDCTVVKIIKIYNTTAVRSNVMELIVIHNRETNTYGILIYKRYRTMGDKYGFEMIKTHDYTLMGEGSRLKKGIVLARSNAVVDGVFCYGLELMTTYLTIKGYTEEDANLMSDTACVKAKHTKLITYKYSVGNSDIPKLLNKNKSGRFTFLPNIGTMINKNKLICGKTALTKYSVMELKKYNLRNYRRGDHLMWATDRGTVVDIKVIYNGKPLPKGREHLYKELMMYADAYSDSKVRIGETFKELEQDPDAKFDPLATKIATKAYIMHPNKRRKLGLHKGRDMLELFTIFVTIRSIHELHAGSKSSGLYGDKSTMSERLKDSEMPYIINQFGEKQIVENIKSPETMPNRANPTQLFELEVKGAVEVLCTKLRIDSKNGKSDIMLFKDIVDFLSCFYVPKYKIFKKALADMNMTIIKPTLEAIINDGELLRIVLYDGSVGEASYQQTAKRIVVRGFAKKRATLIIPKGSPINHKGLEIQTKVLVALQTTMIINKAGGGKPSGILPMNILGGIVKPAENSTPVPIGTTNLGEIEFTILAGALPIWVLSHFKKLGTLKGMEVAYEHMLRYDTIEKIAFPDDASSVQSRILRSLAQTAGSELKYLSNKRT